MEPTGHGGKLNQNKALLLVCCFFLSILSQQWKRWLTFITAPRHSTPSQTHWELALEKVLVEGKVSFQESASVCLWCEAPVVCVTEEMEGTGILKAKKRHEWKGGVL